jgi:predicted enzyme related to lactoylglutathione lyase
MERTKPGEFNWLDLSAKDFAAQSEFYEALFGWAHSDMPFGEGQMYRMFYKDGKVVAAVSQLAPELVAAGVPTAWNTYVATDDVDETVAKAVELDATVALPPTDVPGSGRMAAIQDPTGGVLFFWKPGTSSSTNTMSYFEPGTLSWNDLNARDLEMAAAFYSALLGWEFRKRDGEAMPYWEIRVDGQGQGGMMPMPEMVPPEVPSFWMPYFGSADVASDVAKARALGAAVLVEPTPVEDTVSFAVLTDPLGATFALMQPLTEMPA